MLTPYRLLALVTAAALAGCAAAVPGFSPPNPRADKVHGAAPAGGGVAADGHYALNESEAKFDCKKLSGSIHIGILQLREASARHQPSPVASQLQKMSAPVNGGSAYGMDPDAETARTRARIEAFNARLAEKKCPAYDLAAELKPGNTGSPTPVRAGKRG